MTLRWTLEFRKFAGPQHLMGEEGNQDWAEGMVGLVTTASANSRRGSEARVAHQRCPGLEIGSQVFKFS